MDSDNKIEFLSKEDGFKYIYPDLDLVEVKIEAFSEKYHRILQGDLIGFNFEEVDNAILHYYAVLGPLYIRKNLITELDFGIGLVMSVLVEDDRKLRKENEKVLLIKFKDYISEKKNSAESVDQDLLKLIIYGEGIKGSIKEGLDFDIRSEAVKYITDQNIIYEIVSTHNWYSIRNEAIIWIEDEEKLMEMINAHLDEISVFHIISKLENDRILNKIAGDDKFLIFDRYWAAKKLDDRHLIESFRWEYLKNRISQNIFAYAIIGILISTFFLFFLGKFVDYGQNNSTRITGRGESITPLFDRINWIPILIITILVTTGILYYENKLLEKEITSEHN